MENKIKILLIDDDLIGSKMISARLAKKGFDVHHNLGDQEIISLIVEVAPDIILLDIIFPETSGIELLSKIRKNFERMDLPIIMVTAKSEESDIIDCLEKGANDYITKPINLNVAVARINTHTSINNLWKESLKNKKLEAINSLIITYNHEILNPLTIAKGNLDKKLSQITQKNINTSIDALNRMSEILKKISKVTDNDNIEYIKYTKESKRLKLS